MQQILELLETDTQNNKFVSDQLTDQPIEEIFESGHQKYYGQDEIVTSSQEHANRGMTINGTKSYAKEISSSDIVRYR
jgi:hypothetical protein